VHHTRGVRAGHASQDVHEQSGRLVQARRGVPEQLGQGRALDQLQHQGRRAAYVDDIDHADQIGVAQARLDAGGLGETLDRLWAAEVTDLERPVDTQIQVPDPVDDPAGPAAQHFGDPVASKLITGRELPMEPRAHVRRSTVSAAYNTRSTWPSLLITRSCRIPSLRRRRRSAHSRRSQRRRTCWASSARRQISLATICQ